MSDMLGGDASGGARPLPPSEFHDEYLELCATATTGSLNAEERRRLSAHLAQCNSCREVMAQYDAIVGRVIPAWTPEPAGEDEVPAGWRADEAESQLIARLRESDGSTGYKGAPIPRKPLGSPKVPRTLPEALWGHLWGQLAAALLLVAALGSIAYRMGMRRAGNLAPSAPPATISKPATDARVSSPPREDPNAPGEAVQSRFRSEIKEKLAEIDRLKAEESQTEEELSLAKADKTKFAQDRAALSEQLKAALGSLAAAQQKLDFLTSQSSQDGARAAALEQKIDQVTASIGERDQEIARERALLDKDRDIRELMGSRDLYIAEVYDVAKTGDTQKPFGRVFYTRGKSLIFYAYDLDQQAGIERSSAFQAWGRVGPDRDRAINLGILYQDNSAKKRWVLKSDNPKALAQIDAVFVTVEPNGGSPHPSGKPLLFAYLKVQPNHP